MGSKSFRQLAAEKAFPVGSKLLSQVMCQLASTIHQLAYHGISHRYIRPEYIFYTRNRTIKVTHQDMMCFAWNPAKSEMVSRSKGLHDQQEHLWDHLPPECFSDFYNAFPVDIWSFGVVLVSAVN